MERPLETGKTCRQTRQMVPEPNDILTQFLFNQTRNNTNLLTQFITGHNYLRYHKSKINPNTDPNCRLCGADVEDSWHLLTKCDALFRTSYETFLSDDIQKLPHPKLVLQYIRSTGITKLMEPEEEDDVEEEEVNGEEEVEEDGEQ